MSFKFELNVQFQEHYQHAPLDLEQPAKVAIMQHQNHQSDRCNMKKTIANQSQFHLTGKPFNIASYALLTHMLAQQCDLDVGDFIWTGGDCHIYSNHHEQVELQLSRAPYPYPTLHIKRRPDSIFDYQYEDFEVLDYQCHPAIKAPVAV